MRVWLKYVYFGEHILTTMIDGPVVKSEFILLKDKGLIPVEKNIFMKNKIAGVELEWMKRMDMGDNPVGSITMGFKCRVLCGFQSRWDLT